MVFGNFCRTNRRRQGSIIHSIFSTIPFVLFCSSSDVTCDDLIQYTCYCSCKGSISILSLPWKQSGHAIVYSFDDVLKISSSRSGASGRDHRYLSCFYFFFFYLFGVLYSGLFFFVGMGGWRRRVYVGTVQYRPCRYFHYRRRRAPTGISMQTILLLFLRCLCLHAVHSWKACTPVYLRFAGRRYFLVQACRDAIVVEIRLYSVAAACTCCRLLPLPAVLPATFAACCRTCRYTLPRHHCRTLVIRDGLGSIRLFYSMPCRQAFTALSISILLVVHLETEW